MRLYEYLNTQEKSTAELIITNCSEFLKEVGKVIQIYRGTNKRISNDGIELRYPRTDRRPKDTPQPIHDALDREFKKKFGWKVRSEGVFTSNAYSQAVMFGDYGYNFFPLDGYKYVYSNDVTDLTAYYSRTYGISFEAKPENITSTINMYKDSGLKNIQSRYGAGTEIPFYCPNGYYLIENSLYREIWSDIYNGDK